MCKTIINRLTRVSILINQNNKRRLFKMFNKNYFNISISYGKSSSQEPEVLNTFVKYSNDMEKLEITYNNSISQTRSTKVKKALLHKEALTNDFILNKCSILLKYFNKFINKSTNHIKFKKLHYFNQLFSLFYFIFVILLKLNIL